MSLLLAFVMAVSFNIPAFAATSALLKSDGIAFIKQNVTDTEAYLQYYLTTDGQTTLITESTEVKDGQISTSFSSVEVDETGNVDSSTRKTQQFTSSIVDKMLIPEIGLRSSTASECN